MYDYEASDTDYSYEYSDVEYNTLDPYDYELNNFSNNKNEYDTTEEKLLMYLETLDLDGVKTLLPGLLEQTKKIDVDDRNVLENGDSQSYCSEGDEEDTICNGCENNYDDGEIASMSSIEDINESDDDIPDLNNKVNEVILKGGVTPLMVAISLANVPLVEYIISLGVNVNYSQSNSNNCALLSLTSHISVDWGFLNHRWDSDASKCLKMLIDAGVNVKVKGFLKTEESGYTALHYAAKNNFWEMLGMLIQAGADVDAMTNQKETALMLSATSGYVVCCNILLLAGANAHLTDRGGCNAAYMAGIENHKTLSDAINVYSGSAQHNVELYKIWSQYVKNDSISCIDERNCLEIMDNLANTCIESFCLALDAPYLVKVLQDQGVTINDLKLMSESKLREIGVSDEDCEKILNAMQDFNRNSLSKNPRICFEYARPLKIVTMIEIVGNMSEHLELLVTNLECWHTHLTKKYDHDMMLHKSTIGGLQSSAKRCIRQCRCVFDQLRVLKMCDRTYVSNQVMVAMDKACVDVTLSMWPNRCRSILAASSILALSLSVAFMYRRLR